MSFYKKIPNVITISRIIMSFLFVYNINQQYQGHNRTMNLLVLFIGICSSDLLDGNIARKINAVSKFGAKLDVFADLLYIILSYVTLVNIKILPMWFLVFVCFKFSEFVITSKFIRKSTNLEGQFVFDKVGRIVSATFLIIPGIICFYNCFYIYNLNLIFNYFINMLFVAGLLSSYLRIKNCFKVSKIKEYSKK